MTATIPRPRSRVRVAREEYELSPKTVSGVIEAAPTQAWDADLVQQVGQHPAVVALSWCDDNREGRPRPPTAWWISVESPPRERPRP